MSKPCYNNGWRIVHDVHSKVLTATCSTVDDICLSDLNKCMGIFVVCQLQLNSVTLFLTRTVHVHVLAASVLVFQPIVCFLPR